MWDLYDLSIDRIYKLNFSMKYKVRSHPHKYRMVRNFDLKYKISWFLIGSEGLFTEPMGREGVSIFYSCRNFKIQIEVLNLFRFKFT